MTDSGKPPMGSAACIVLTFRWPLHEKPLTLKGCTSREDDSLIALLLKEEEEEEEEA